MLEKVSGLRFRSLDKKERMKTFFWEQHWRSLALSLSSYWPWKRPKPPRCTNNSAQVVETVEKDLGLNLGFAVYYLWPESGSWPVQRELQSPMSDCGHLVWHSTLDARLGAWSWQRLPECPLPALLCLQHKIREWHSVLASGFNLLDF